MAQLGRDGRIGGQDRPAVVVQRAGAQVLAQQAGQHVRERVQARLRRAHAGQQAGQAVVARQALAQGPRERHHRLAAGQGRVERLGPRRGRVGGFLRSGRGHFSESVAMQIMITHGGMSRTRVVHVSPAQVVAVGCSRWWSRSCCCPGAIYHYFFLKAAREGWPVVSQLVKLVVHDESAQRDKIMRENLDAMAQKVGDMQARMIKIEAMGDRVSGMAGLKPEDLSGLTRAQGRRLRRPVRADDAAPASSELNGALEALAEAAGEQSDVLTLTESRLLESRLKTLMIPSSRPDRRGRWARASASAPTRSPAAARCTRASTSRRRSAPRSTPPPAAWCAPPRCIPSTA